MKSLFWLLDINDEMTEEGPEIHLWGLDDKYRRVLIVDRDFPPYFYLLLEEGADSGEVIREIKDKVAPSSIAVTEVVDKKYFGNPVRAVRLHAEIPVQL
ncbi:MAG: hypothetical protein V1850_04920 [Candidatus Bathyarchaeota archaeon]